MSIFELGPTGVFEHPYDRSGNSQKVAKHQLTERELQERRRATRESWELLEGRLKETIDSYIDPSNAPAIIRNDLELTQTKLAMTDSEGNDLPKDELVKVLKKLHKEQSGDKNDRFTHAGNQLEKLGRYY